MSQISTGLDRHEKRGQVVANSSIPPLVVTPDEAGRLLSLSATRIYELLRAGELQSYRDGRGGRRIVMSSINAYVARRLAENSVGGWRPIRPQPPRPLKQAPLPKRRARADQLELPAE